MNLAVQHQWDLSNEMLSLFIFRQSVVLCMPSSLAVLLRLKPCRDNTRRIMSDSNSLTVCPGLVD